MGKPYEQELKLFQKTIDWSKKQDVSSIKEFFQTFDEPVYCIGSGGSLTVACLCSQMLESIGITSKYTTAFDFLSKPEPINKSKYILFTASGNNPDSIAVMKKLNKFSLNKQSITITLNTQSKVKKYESLNNKIHSFSIPSKNDGFLATNTLIASCILITKLLKKLSFYNINLNQISPSPIQINKKLLNNKTNALVVYGKWGLPAAIDIESKLSEAGVLSVQLADFRNFAHGRHNWIDKNLSETLIISIETKEDSKVATNTLKQLPRESSIVRIMEEESSPIGSINLILKVMSLVFQISSFKNIDPGKPGVPSYGSSIYNLNILKHYDILSSQKLTKKDTAILKKSKYPHFNLIPNNLKKHLGTTYDQYLKDLYKTQYKAIIFDYDATLLSRFNRYGTINKKMQSLLNKTLESGIIIAIVTGRGKSVYNDFSKTILAKYHSQIFIGYYNGSLIKNLSEGKPNKEEKKNKNIIEFGKILENNVFIQKIANIDVNNIQISITLKNLIYTNHLLSILKELAFKHNIKQLKILKSSHSVDIIPESTSKTKVYQYLNKKFNLNNQILSIGDSGQWPGNDFELLSYANALSVDSVSTLEDTCWNLEPSTKDSTKGTMKYLKKLTIHKGYVMFQKDSE